MQQKGGECYAEGSAEAPAAAGPQGQAVAEAEGADDLSAPQQLPLEVVAIHEAVPTSVALPLFSSFIFTKTAIILVRNMAIIRLRKVISTDKRYFARWWRDKELLKLTSGILRRVSDKEIDKYFRNILESKKDYHFMIVLNSEIVGHISLAKRRNEWCETQIVIGEKKNWSKGYGSKAITLLTKKAKRLGISKIYLEVRLTNIRAIHAYEKCGFQKVKIIRYPKNKYLSETLRMELVK